MSKSQTKKKPPNYGNTASHDMKIWQRIQKTIEKAGHSFADVLESFPVYIRRVNLSRFLAHYELYRMVKDIPGSIVECGVYRGASLFSFARFLEIFHAGDRTRKVYGFENFAGFESIHEKDGPIDLATEKVQRGWNPGAYYEELKEHIDIFHADSFVPWSKRIVLIEGDLCQTAFEFMRDNPGLRIALLHLDVDVYEPTFLALKAFYPAVVKGGVVILDQYGATNWPGESLALEEYFGDNMPKLQKHSFISLPGGFFIKE